MAGIKLFNAFNDPIPNSASHSRYLRLIPKQIYSLKKSFQQKLFKFDFFLLISFTLLHLVLIVFFWSNKIQNTRLNIQNTKCIRPILISSTSLDLHPVLVILLVVQFGPVVQHQVQVGGRVTLVHAHLQIHLKTFETLPKCRFQIRCHSKRPTKLPGCA